jgi:hypothetical protein
MRRTTAAAAKAAGRLRFSGRDIPSELSGPRPAAGRTQAMVPRIRPDQLDLGLPAITIVVEEPERPEAGTGPESSRGLSPLCEGLSVQVSQKWLRGGGRIDSRFKIQYSKY